MKSGKMEENRFPVDDDKRLHKQDIDNQTGFEVLSYFQRFNQKNDIYNRTVWDSSLDANKKAGEFFGSHSKIDLARIRTADGYGHKDYALRNATWQVMDIAADLKSQSDNRTEGFLDTYTLHKPGSSGKRAVESPVKMSAEIKKVAGFIGADLTGICRYDERWVYSHSYNRIEKGEKPVDLPDDLPYAIVVAKEMDYELMKTVPSTLGSAATGLGYSMDFLIVVSLAQYIRNLGYRAVASQNDTALSVPLAIQAGLGEYGRNGLLITPKFGPRVRLGKVFTDLPLASDKPVKFGVQEFCQICLQCAYSCPARAISISQPSEKTNNISNIKGVCKWSIDPEKCFQLWTNQNTDCSICIRVCPYNKDYSQWIHRIGRRLSGTFLRKFMLKLDLLFDFGARKPPQWWWNRIFK